MVSLACAGDSGERGSTAAATLGTGIDSAGETGGAEGSDGGGSSGGVADADDGGSGENPGGSEDGCGCRSDGRGPAALFGLFGALAIRRRRAVTSAGATADRR